MEDMQRRIDRADIQKERQDAIKVRLYTFLDNELHPSWCKEIWPSPAENNTPCKGR